MKLEDQLVSLELSKQLKEAGYKQEGMWWWKHWVEKNKSHIDNQGGVYAYGTVVKVYVAPTVAELGERLPVPFINMITKSHYKYWSSNNRKYDIDKCKTEANARAKMWLYLKKEGLLNAH